MSNVRLLSLAGLTAAASILLYGCGLECGPGLTDEDGQCVVEAQGCADGTSLQGGECLLDTTGCGEGTTFSQEEGACVPAEEACDESASFDQETLTCVPNTEVVCGAGTEAGDDGWCVPADVTCGDKTQLDDNGRCVVSTAVCGPGTELDANSGECLLVDDACGAGLSLDAESGRCTASDELCDAGTKYDDDTGLCLPDSCQEGDVLIGTLCMSPAEELAEDADREEIENNDPALGGNAQPLLVNPVGGDAFVFTGAIGEPADFDGDGGLEQDVDVYEFEVNDAGEWFEIMVQSTGLQAPAFTVEGPNGFVRHSPIGRDDGAARTIVTPAEGTYTLTVLPSVLLESDGSRAPMGGDDWGYVGSLKTIEAPEATEIDMTDDEAEITGEYIGLSDNLFELTNLEYGEVVRLDMNTSADGVEGMIELWGESGTIVESTPSSEGNAVDFVVADSSAKVMLDWTAMRGDGSDFAIDVSVSGSEGVITLEPEASETRTVTVEVGDKIEARQTNPEDEPLNVVINDPFGEEAAADEELAAGSTLSAVAEVPGDFEVVFTNDADENVDATLTAKLAAPSGFGEIPVGVTRTTGPFDLAGDETRDIEFVLRPGEIARIGQVNADGTSIDYDLYEPDGSAMWSDSYFYETDAGIDEPDDFAYVYSENGGTYTFSVWNDHDENPIEGLDVSIENLGTIMTDLGTLEDGQTLTHEEPSPMARDELQFFRLDVAESGMFLVEGITPNDEDIDLYFYEGGLADDTTGSSTTSTDEFYADPTGSSGEVIIVVHAWAPLPSYELRATSNPSVPSEPDFTSTPDLVIPDHDLVGVTDTINVDGCTAVDSVSAYVDITHPDTFDLQIYLTSPNGTTVNLYHGSSGEDLAGWYPEELESNEALTEFEDEYGNGEWTLNVLDDDDYEDSDGLLNEWSLAMNCK